MGYNGPQWDSGENMLSPFRPITNAPLHDKGREPVLEKFSQHTFISGPLE